MNIVSSIVGIAIMGAAAPSVMKMSLAPIEAQVRARNFSVAEASAVAFSATWEGKPSADWISDPSLVPENCDTPVDTSGNSTGFDITCWGGESIARGDDTDSNYYQEVTRSFRLASSAAASEYDWFMDTPVNIGAHQCPVNDEWGITPNTGFNDRYMNTLGACVPQVAWSENKYLKSDPDKWQYDLRQYADMKGYETHPDFLGDEDG